MPFNPPLRIAQLRDIQDRHRGPDGKIRDTDLLALLKEIKRYRSFMLRTKQLSGEFKRPSGVLRPVYDEWLEILGAEPCVAEQEQMVRELLELPTKLRKGMAPRWDLSTQWHRVPSKAHRHERPDQKGVS